MADVFLRTRPINLRKCTQEPPRSRIHLRLSATLTIFETWLYL